MAVMSEAMKLVWYIYDDDLHDHNMLENEGAKETVMGLADFQLFDFTYIVRC